MVHVDQLHQRKRRGLKFEGNWCTPRVKRSVISSRQHGRRSYAVHQEKPAPSTIRSNTRVNFPPSKTSRLTDRLTSAGTGPSPRGRPHEAGRPRLEAHAFFQVSTQADEVPAFVARSTNTPPVKLQEKTLEK